MTMIKGIETAQQETIENIYLEYKRGGGFSKTFYNHLENFPSDVLKKEHGLFCIHRTPFSEVSQSALVYLHKSGAGIVVVECGSFNPGCIQITGTPKNREEARSSLEQLAKIFEDNLEDLPKEKGERYFR